jgi:CheY-like chemotaxis protein
MAKILVIDDNDALRKLVSRMLQGEGHEVIAAADGKQGVALFSEQLPDLVITDLIMPDMDGTETVIALRKIAPAVKVIMMSGGGEVGSGEQYLQSVDSILNTPYTLSKPFTMVDMLSLVNKALESSL